MNGKNPSFDVDAAAALIRGQLGDFQPETSLVLGSGLGFLADERIRPVKSIAYEDVPGLPVSTVEGHAGRFVFGWLGGQPVACMQGRFHFYEGYSLEEITRPVRLFARLGIKELLLTNAAGGIREDLKAASLMLISDHINLLGSNPLRGPNLEAFGTRFPDMSEVYDPVLRQRAQTAAGSLGIELAEGIYLATPGPSFETPAEIRAFRVLGADAVGMSTVPEAIVARHCGLKVCGISCISNLASGISPHHLSHAEVVEAAEIVKEPFADLVTRITLNSVVESG